MMSTTNVGIIAVLTDFGNRDPYVGEVKASVLRECRNAVIVDITNDVESFNVLNGAFLLYVSYPYFPAGTVFLSVVDPGVGTSRRGIILRTRNYWFVGPDNGLCYPAASRDGIIQAYEIDLSAYPRRGGETFHGRDVFARVAGELAANKRPAMRVINPNELVKLTIEDTKIEDGELIAKAMHIDKFGNVILNVSRDKYATLIDGMIGEVVEVIVGRRSVEAKLVRAYGEADVGGVLLLFGGTGFLEIAKNQGDASVEVGIKIGDVVRLRFMRQ